MNANATKDDVLTLNIGGERTIQVSRSVLTRVKDSALEAMFSGRHTLKTINENIFVDRDSEPFSKMISYLRNGLKYAEIEDKEKR